MKKLKRDLNNAPGAPPRPRTGNAKGLLIRVYFDQASRLWCVSRDRAVRAGAYLGKILATFRKFTQAARFALTLVRRSRSSAQLALGA